MPTPPGGSAARLAATAALLFLGLLPRVAAQGSLPRIVRLVPEVRYQTFVGWEVTAPVPEPGLLDDADWPLLRDQLAERAVREAGLSRLRVEVTGGVESPTDAWAAFRAGEIDRTTWQRLRHAAVNDDGDPATLAADGFHFGELDAVMTELVLPVAERLRERGERLHLSLCYVGAPAAGDAAHSDAGTAPSAVHTDPAEYAELVLATCLHLQETFGLLPDTWEVVAEPDRLAGWDGALLGRALAAAHQRLAAAGVEPRFAAPSASEPGAAVTLFDALDDVPGALEALDELSFHRSGRPALLRLGALADRAARHGLGLANLQQRGSGFGALLDDLRTGRAVAWSGSRYLLGDSAEADLYLVDRSRPEVPRLVLGPRARELQQATRAIRPGMTRVEVVSESSTLEPVAFVGEDGRVVIVIRGHTEGPIAVEGLPAGTYGSSWTTTERADVLGFDVDHRAGTRLQTSLPAPGVLSIFRR